LAGLLAASTTIALTRRPRDNSKKRFALAVSVRLTG
jgi:hypothetical protein